MRAGLVVRLVLEAYEGGACCKSCVGGCLRGGACRKACGGGCMRAGLVVRLVLEVV